MRWLGVWAVVLSLGCGRTQLVEVQPTGRIVPVEQWVEQGEAVSWRGIAEATRSPEFVWRIVERPGGVAELRTEGAEADLTPDAPGDWVIGLMLRDGDRSSVPSLALLHVRPSARDAGEPPMDAGSFDAGRPDAGAVDAGVPDAGAFDAGTPVVDAGVRDAGPSTSLDAGAIYLAGTLSEGACWLDALADVFNPNVASTGFDCSFNHERAMIRPTDGVVLYTNTFEDLLREYHCDACTYTGTYPTDVLANDTVIATPCPANDRLSGFLVSASGDVLHRCYLSSSVWRDSSGAQVFANTPMVTLLALGADGWAFSRSRIINWRTAASTPISGLPTVVDILATRWSPPDAFLVAFADSAGEPGSLWRVTTNGVATSLGSFGARPPATTSAGAPRLDGAGRLFVRGRDSNQAFVDIVMLFEVGQPSRVIYTEASDPLVKLHISSLVTGP